jgi:hypothetical protein
VVYRQQWLDAGFSPGWIQSSGFIERAADTIYHHHHHYYYYR